MSKITRLCLLVLAILLAVIAMISGYGIGRYASYPVAYSEYIVKYAYKNKLDPFLVMAVIKQESNFIPDAYSGYAYGLMQLTPETASWNAMKLGIKEYDYLDPETNIRFGCHYLKHLIDMYDNIDTALAAYNGGMGNVDEWLEDERYSNDGKTLKEIPFPETKEYVKKVNGYWNKYEEEYG